MPNLEFELEQLRVAERHIDEAAARIAHMRSTLQQERANGFAAVESERALRVAEESLETFHDHRRLIVQTIAQIRSGELPST